MISSSESEDDCYGDAVWKLEKLKNVYRDDKIESIDLLDESAELAVTTCTIERDFKEQVIGNVVKVFKDTVRYKPDVDQEEFLIGATKRITRSSAREAKVNVGGSSVSNARCVLSRGRGGKRNSANKDSSRPRCRGRGRGRGRGAPVAPVYNVGDADEYPDQSQQLALFSITNDDVVLVEDSDIFEQNEELSVKMCWRSTEYCTFTVRKHQKLSAIFKHFAEKENVPQDRLLFMYNDKILKPDDTPDSIHYNIAKFIEGGVVSQDVTNLHNRKQHTKDTGIQIKFQSLNSKKPLEFTIQPAEKLATAMIKCAEQLELPLSKLKFVFDGYTISGGMTANELELEGGECIDVKLL